MSDAAPNNLNWLTHRYTSDIPSLASQSEPLPELVAAELVREGAVSILVEGPAGTGKTRLGTCVQDILNRNKKRAFYINVLKASKERVKSFDDFIKFLEKEKELDPGELQESQLHQYVLILDECDELDTYLLTLCQKGAKLLLARRYRPDVHTRKITLGGFDCYDTTKQFITHQLTTVHNVKKTQPLLSYIQARPIIRELSTVPLMSLILVEIYAADNKCIKTETETLLIHKILIGWIKKYVPSLSVKSLYMLDPEKRENLLHIALIAFHSLQHKASEGEGFSLSAEEISSFNLEGGYASLDDVKKFNLLQCNGNSVHSFIHPIIKEFLAAFYLSCQPQNEQISFYCELFPKHIGSFKRVCLFHFGLTRLETEEFLNPSKLILAGMIESLAHVTQKQSGELHLELQQLIQACLFEAHDPTLIKNFCQQYTDIMTLTFPNTRSLDDLRLTSHLNYVILQSGIKSWELSIPSEHDRGKTDNLAFPIAMANSSIKIAVIIESNRHPSCKLRAIFEANTTKRTGRATEMLKRAKTEEEKERYFKLAMVVTGQRETLHRVTQLFSPVPVRSDAGDPAYASLITCKCVEEKFEKEVKFEPVHPIHALPVSPSSKKIRGGDRDETALKHMTQKHEGNYLEYIVLNQPSLRSITFSPPGRSQQCRLVVSSEKLSPSTSGRIAKEAESSLANQENAVSCRTVEEDPQEEKSELVPHGLPLPKSKTKIEADKANVLQIAGTAGTRVHGGDNAPEAPVTPAQAAPSHKNFQEPEISLYSPAPVQAETAEKIMWKPGMIMFTTIPDVFQKHKTYSLPVEDKQIRKGGNGTIFATEYFGYSLVAKKTLFRTREFNIIQRLKHANIVPLLALMVGEASHRRRFFCYHMLPRLSGDAARMLSDHPEYTLSSLKAANSDNPMRFGLALGNMRYLLAEVLKGLAYMHDLHIIHRDVKASNILVRFHCQHENLLWCTCPHKYTVCVCDFDAALELGDQNEMLPVSQTNQVYYLPPVGTQGFRSPEGSQLVVASHGDALSPRLTPHTDVWSFGVLMLRLFIGEDGPSSQRHNAILLLKYHETPRRAGNQWRLRVTDDEVEKLVKLPILKRKLSGVSNLVDFVSRCLHVDPDQRPTAKDLLQHSFLF